MSKPWQHPQANQQIQLEGHAVAYVLERSVRLSVGLLVNREGLRIRAPKRMSKADIEAALQSKASWILGKLKHVQAHIPNGVEQTLRWHDGMHLDWLGVALTVRWQAQPRRLCWREADTLWVTGPASDDQATQMRHAVEVWAKQQAEGHFTNRLDYFSLRLGVRWTRLQLSSARTRWGSAKSDGSIRLHWRLMQFDPTVLDYVVAHELAHLRHMNHSPAFWDTVAEVVPDWPLRRQQLRNQRLPVW